METVRLTYEVDGDDLRRAGEAAGKMKLALKQLGLGPDIIRRASVCMYEGEINMVLHADGGTAGVTVGMDELSIELADRGPGIPDVKKAMEPGYTTAGEAARELGFGAGMGLPNMSRHADEMSIETEVGVGTRVLMKIYIPPAGRALRQDGTMPRGKGEGQT